MDSQVNKALASVLRTIIYYDIFNYPLTENDILTNCGSSNASHSPCRDALKFLVDNNVIYSLGAYYSLNNNYADVERRIKGNEEAKKWIKLFAVLIVYIVYLRKSGNATISIY